MALKHTVDSTANNSAKTFTVPNGKTWKILYAHVTYVATATVGNRILEISVLDKNSAEIIDLHSGIVQTASQTIHYIFLPGIYRETAVVNTSIQVPLPQDFILLDGWTLKFWDNAAVDAAADDMTVTFVYSERNFNDQSAIA